MIIQRKAQDRGHFDHGWLDTWHTFSFADYHDPAQMGFGPLRVINDDRIKPGSGFGMHGHRDMEIITYMLSGTLEHQDSMGHHERITAGEVQRMSAGSGVRHSEAVPADSDEVHLLQIWIQPNAKGVKPEYEQRDMPKGPGELKLIASPDARDGSMRIYQDAYLLAAHLEPGMETVRELAPGRSAWVQIATGAAEVNGMAAIAGDGFAFTGESAVRVTGIERGETLIFDLPPAE